MRITTFDEFKELAQRATFVPVCKEIVADLLTPVSAFLKIAEHSDYAFLLESVEGGEHVGRYSFLGKDPFLILRSRDGRTTMERGGGTSESGPPFVDTLRRPVRVPRRRPRSLVRAGARRPRRRGQSRRHRRIHDVRHGAGVRSRPAPD